MPIRKLKYLIKVIQRYIPVSLKDQESIAQ